MNPDLDWYNEDKRQEMLEAKREQQTRCLMSSRTFIEDVVFADQIPDSVFAAIAQACGKIAHTDDREQIDAAYRTIGRAIADHIAEKAWEL